MRPRSILGAKLNAGYPSGDNYPVTSSLRPGGAEAALSGNTIAATKLAHEFGHVEFTAATPQNVFSLQNLLIPVWNSVFQATGQTSQPDSVRRQRKWERGEADRKLQKESGDHPQQGLDCWSSGAPGGLGLAAWGAAEAV